MNELLRRHPVLAYTAARAGLLTVAIVVLGALGLRGPWLVVGAILLSGAVSFVLLSRMRDEMAQRLAGRVERARSSLDDSAAAEDDDPPSR
ncbi:MAG: DUF4229 domain-containing protein [Actinomycetota bacterium]|nr:DUF4229 domain-containing protein [Actinomycetota bacterium]